MIEYRTLVTKVLLLPSLALGALAGCVPMDDEAAMILEDLAARDKPSRLKARTPTPTRTSLTYRIGEQHYEADLYQPGDRTLAGIVLIPGVAERGRRDPRLVAFANTLARARFLVLVPDLPGLRELKVRIRDVQGVVDAFSHLTSRPELPQGGATGIGAFSYAVGPAVLAALEPAIRDRAGFVLGVGGYHDLERVLAFFTTGYFEENGTRHYLEPNRYGKWVFVRSNSDRLADTTDREIIQTMAERRLDDPEAPIADLVPRLGPEGRSLYALITNTEPAQVPALLARLPSGIRDDIAAFTLANKDLSRLGAQLILIHGRNDNIIPYTESVALAEAVPPGRARLFVVRGLAHVDLRPGLLDRWTLWRAVRSVLAQRAAADARSRSTMKQKNQLTSSPSWKKT